MNLRLLVAEALPLALFNVLAFPPADFAPGAALASAAADAVPCLQVGMILHRIA